MSTIIITGAAGNLGTAVTALFLEQGYRVIATASSEESKKNMPVREGLQVAVVDLADEAAAAAFVQRTIDAYETIDAALMLAGGFTMGGMDVTTAGDIRNQIALNFETAYNLARPLYRHMREQGRGRLVFIGARPALQPADGRHMVAYALSKSLLFQLADYINADAKGKDIAATVVVPSILDTQPNREGMPGADFENWVKPEELAGLLAFVCSDGAAFLRETVLKAYNKA